MIIKISPVVVRLSVSPTEPKVSIESSEFFTFGICFAIDRLVDSSEDSIILTASSSVSVPVFSPIADER